MRERGKMKKFKKIITAPFKFLFLLPVYFYKFVISPLLPHVCRFTPSCSVYFILAVREHGIVKGGWLGLKRICRCVPTSKGGLDLVQPNWKGDKKWLF